MAEVNRINDRYDGGGGYRVLGVVDYQVPGFAGGLRDGEMAQMVTTGQRALPKRLQELGFEFRHRDLEPALRDVLNRQ